jgi:glucosamine-6-phosphate deaminase
VPRRLRIDALDVEIHDDVAALALAAAREAAATVRAAVERRGEARVLLATGNSQLAFLAALVASPGVDWTRVRAFHLDEYVGISPAHPASFQRYMRERVGTRLPLRSFDYLDGDAADPEAEARRYESLLRARPVDLCCCGIGENGHLAFNDPPVADFDDPRDVKVVPLAEESRRQQVGEGHFATIDAVPTHAITVTIPALLRAGRVLAIVPEARKAAAVRRSLCGPVAPSCPASALRRHAHATCYLDAESAAELET